MSDLVLRVEGHTLPARDWCGHPSVHVGAQLRADAVQLHPGGSPTAVLTYTVRVRETPAGGRDFGGPYVHGRPGDRFLYVTWGDVDAAGAFTMFRRAKLRPADIPGEAVDAALRAGRPLVTALCLTAADGSPRCGSIRPPETAWRVG